MATVETLISVLCLLCLLKGRKLSSEDEFIDYLNFLYFLAFLGVKSPSCESDHAVKRFRGIEFSLIILSFIDAGFITVSIY